MSVSCALCVRVRVCVCVRHNLCACVLSAGITYVSDVVVQLRVGKKKTKTGMSWGEVFFFFPWVFCPFGQWQKNPLTNKNERFK